ncbi:anti-sigma factor [Gottfriedia acidiceleris]|uniref:anti-sigma factor n=1 Tax=Bacillaceae TaxID=186817 RepID=UPI000BEB91A0|nr:MULTISPECIES: anti-sigma factor [unclassified Bacillus (in: firmicutes)]PEC47864.1 hypothetical protein CON00_19195 [Bacillus sp. AFS096315]PFM76963.1 hypothetical protein COJ46_19150 [Bacillus sp. AFS077874]
MTNNKGCSFSEEIVSNMLGEVTEEEKILFEEHILNCVFCRLEVQEMEEAWNVIPLSLDDVEVPTDLKEEVMNYIFPSDHSIVKNPIVHFRKFLYVLAAAIILVSFVGLIWNNLYLKQELAQVSKKTISPTAVEQVYSLKSTNPGVNLANGNAWVYNQGDRKQIVFKLRGLATTKGTEAYQAWLIHDGKRRSAGTFHVDKNGNGFLTYVLNEKEQPFEAIGISLEPDANSIQPRGKKVLGT